MTLITQRIPSTFFGGENGFPVIEFRFPVIEFRPCGQSTFVYWRRLSIVKESDSCRIEHDRAYRRMDCDECATVLRWHCYFLRDILARQIQDVRIWNEDEIEDATLRALANDDEGLIDLRSLEAYRCGHIRRSTWIHCKDLISRRPLLPRRRAEISLLADAYCDMREALEYLTRDYSIRFAVVIKRNRSSRLFRRAKSLGCFEEGSTSRELWKPSPLLREALPVIESMLYKGSTDSRVFGTLVDIGSGSGRDLIYCARRRWNVIGVDNLPKHRNIFDSLLRTLAKDDLARIRCEFLVRDAETDSQKLPHGVVVNVARYLHKPLLPVIRDSLVTPGGFVVYHTFMEGCEKFGSPKKARFMLQRGELANVFHGWDVIMDEVRSLDDGRPVSYFIARKPCR